MSALPVMFIFRRRTTALSRHFFRLRRKPLLLRSLCFSREWGLVARSVPGTCSQETLGAIPGRLEAVPYSLHS